MKKFPLPFQNMVRADLFSGFLAVWNALGFAIHFARPPIPSRAVRGEERIPFELISEYTAMKERFKKFWIDNPKTRRTVGVIFIIIGIVSIITPFTPVGFLLIVGLEMFGIGSLFWEKLAVFWSKFKTWWRNN